MLPDLYLPINFNLSLMWLWFLFSRDLTPSTFFFQKSMIKTLLFNVETVALSFLLAKRLMPCFIPCKKILPFQRRSLCLFQQILRRLLRDMTLATYTLKFRLFYTYGDICSPLITFMGTWISFKFIQTISDISNSNILSLRREQLKFM